VLSPNSPLAGGSGTPVTLGNSICNVHLTNRWESGSSRLADVGAEEMGEGTAGIARLFRGRTGPRGRETRATERSIKKPGATFGDAEIRPALRMHLHVRYLREAGTVVLEELGLCRGQVRVDLAVVNGILHGYEIKSDRDSLRRLAGQVDLYGRVLDRATLVVGRRHLTEVLDIVPEWWGVLLVQPALQDLRFKTVRRGRKNPWRDPRVLVELLWLDDAMDLLDQREATRGFRGKPRRIVWDRVCEHFDVDEIAAAVRSHLKARAAIPGSARPS